ncbi:MAG: hypothetical protein LQ339_006504 [Xanthoria mediterranea]|nr:MAG: hypothetical protein LQ339_006504 [Xanthoria mediterranea]
MDEGAHRAGQRLGTSETVSRKESLSEKLNKLTNDTFGRRRTSGINASSESLSSRPRRSYIPTPSLGSRASSLLSGLGLDTRDRADSGATQWANRKDTSRASTRRYSRHVSGSSSSFFESNGLGPLYPRDFLDKSDTDVERKENSRPTQNAQANCFHLQPPSSPNSASEITEASKFNSSTGAVTKLDGGSDISTQSTIKKSRRISDRLARTSFFKQHSARHSIAAVPLTPSTKVKDGESTVKIAERRLMAPIDPPLPRSTTMGPLNGPSAHSRQHSSPRTPSFMRPTSSSAARRSTISNAYKSSPTPLALASGQRTADISGFQMNRERKRAAHEAATMLGSHGISHESTPGLLPGNGLQIMARNGLSAVQERPMAFGVPEHWALKNQPSPPPRIPDPTTSAEADFKSRAPRVAMSPQRYPLGPRYAPITELDAAYAAYAVQPPVPPLPKQLVVDGRSTGNGDQSRGIPRYATQGSRIPRSISNAGDLQFEQGIHQSLGIQPPANEHHLPKNRNETLPPSTSGNSFTDYRAAAVNFPARRGSLAAATRSSNWNAAGSAAVPSSTAPRVVVSVTTDKSNNDGDEVDLTLIRGAQDLRFWAGRYTATSDRVRNDALIPSEAAMYAHNDELRQRVVLQFLSEKCGDDEARESLNTFVRAWAHGWSGGVAGAFLGVAPEAVVPAMPVTEEKKKGGGFMGKVFGRRKS